MDSRLDLVDDWEKRAEEAGYTATKMALKLGVTLRLLESFFRARFGEGPHDWMVRMRMTHAAGLLRAGIPVKIVSSQAGYKQVSHFSREFKRFFGASPVRYVFAENSAMSVKNRRAFRI